MIFANRLALAAALVLLVGCASTPDEPGPSEPVTETPEPAFNEALPPGPITVSPYRDAPAPDASAEIRELFATATDQMTGKDWREARQTLQQIVAQAPELSGPWLNLGIVWVELDEPGQARAAFERALAANPLNVDAYNHLGALERRAGNFAAAQTAYEQALQVWPHSVASHRNYGVLLDIYLGDWERALLHYQAAQYIIENTRGEPDRELTGWIIDLERRIAAGDN